ncbi:MAG: AI-2E family transporter, partial [Myxococcales bacterium]
MSANPPSRRSVPSRVLLACLWAFVLGVLVVFRSALFPFAVALVIAYLLEPLVTRLERRTVGGRRMPRWAGVIGLYAVFFLLLYLAGIAVLPQLYHELARLTVEGRNFLNSLSSERVAEWTASLDAWLVARGIPLDLTPDGSEGRLSLDIQRSARELLSKISHALSTHVPEAVGFGRQLVQNVLGFVFKFFFVLMVAAFILIDWERIGRFVRSMVPAERQTDFGQLLREVDRRLGGVVRGQVIICLVNGALTLVGLLLLNVKFAFVLSALATVLSLVPIFGTIVSSVPIVLIGLAQGWQTGLGALAWIIGIHALEAYFLNPKIMGSHAQIHPVLVAFALLAGERMFGFTGALFAVPVAAILVAAFSFVHGRALAKQGAQPDAVVPAPQQPALAEPPRVA